MSVNSHFKRMFYAGCFMFFTDQFVVHIDVPSVLVPLVL